MHAFRFEAIGTGWRIDSDDAVGVDPRQLLLDQAGIEAWSFSLA